MNFMPKMKSRLKRENLKLALLEKLQSLAEKSMSCPLQKDRMTRNQPNYLIQSGPMTWQVADAMRLPNKKIYNLLRKLSAEGTILQKGGSGCSRWWPLVNLAPWMPLKRLPYRSLGRDLYFDLQCECPGIWDDPELAKLLKHKIKLGGYADSNFFDNVNSKPLEGVCKCGRKYVYQWFPDGIEVGFI